MTFKFKLNSTLIITWDTDSDADTIHTPVVSVIDSIHKVHKWHLNVGHALIKNIELSIGGSRIDKQYGIWMQIWDQLTTKTDQEKAMNICIGNTIDGGQNYSNVVDIFVPLQFFCNRNPGLALPLIALQYHDVRVDFELNSESHCVDSYSTFLNYDISKAQLLVEYIYLDSEERKRFAQASHEYLIEQLQYTGGESVSSNQTSAKYRLNFNHPCKELIWVHEVSSVTNKFDFSIDGAGSTTQLVKDAQILLNGHDRFSIQPGSYFNYVQPLQHHTKTPNLGVNVYSFSIHPEEHQPSGTCNFSRIDNANLQLNLGVVEGNGGADRFVKVWATNYNVLRVMSGMGGLAYSN
jgi:hypothetical protein